MPGTASVAKHRSESAIIAEMERFGMIGRSRAMLELFTTVKRIAPHQSTVLLLGESGTGKELLARALHALGPRAQGPFVPVNCATLTESLLESEIFGHDRGAFTGADAPKAGVMEIADGGTLFLDEVNEMGAGCQAKLLRALERHEFRRVGGTRKIQVDLSVIAATNARLDLALAQGRFRADLYYRLKVVTIVVPPLRERRDAIPVLATRFLEAAVHRTGLSAKRLTPRAMAQLVRHDWPGNIRELRNCMESLNVMIPGDLIDLKDLPGDVRGGALPEIRLPVGTRLEDAEREIIRRTLECFPTIKDAAQALGIGLRTLYTKINRYDLRQPQVPPERRVPQRGPLRLAASR